MILFKNLNTLFIIYKKLKLKKGSNYNILLNLHEKSKV
jgi:hypothetical protein